MPRNGSGSYSLPAGNPVVTGTTISSTTHNNTNNDIATALTGSIAKDGQTVPTANLPMGTFKLTGLGAGSAAGDSVRYEQVPGLVTAEGDLLVGSAAGALRKATTPLAGHIWGLIQSNNGSDATNDIDISAGGASDATGAYWMALTSAITKRLDAAWAVGTNQGGLDTGAIADMRYYIWLIARIDTGVVDALFSTSGTAPTMPANYTKKRLIGWFIRNSGAILAFTVLEVAGGGIHYTWAAPVMDVDASNSLTTSRRTDQLSVPRDFKTHANIVTIVGDASSAFIAWLGDPAMTDAAPSATAPPGLVVNADLGISYAVPLRVITSATGTIAARATLATVDVYRVFTYGWEWGRR